MKCPYAINRVCQTTWDYEYDEDGREISGTKSEIINAEFVDCEQENCGAFKNGECQYRGE